MKVDLTKKVVTALARIDGTLKHTKKLDAIARIFGLTDQTTLMAALKSSGAVHTDKVIGDVPHPYEGVPDDQRKWDAVRAKRRSSYSSSSLPETQSILYEIIYTNMFTLRQCPNLGYAYEHSRQSGKDDAPVYDQIWAREASYDSHSMAESLHQIYNTVEKVIQESDNVFGVYKALPVFPWVLRVPRLRNMDKKPMVFLPEDLFTAFSHADDYVQKMIDQALKGKNFLREEGDAEILENLKISISKNFYESEDLMKSFAPQL